MLLKHGPDGARASDLAGTLQPRWGYLGSAGLGDRFCGILSGWKSTCGSWRRGQHLFAHRACSRKKFPLGTKGK